jgi:hypothetical protein
MFISLCTPTIIGDIVSVGGNNTDSNILIYLGTMYSFLPSTSRQAALIIFGISVQR